MNTRSLSSQAHHADHTQDYEGESRMKMNRVLLKRAADENIPPLTLPSPLLFRCAGRGEGTIESAARLSIGVAAATAVAALAQQRPNVVLIVCDDLNDYITGIPGQTGHPQSITPNIEKLAKSGVAFRRAYSNNPVCAPSRSSYLTGIYPLDDLQLPAIKPDDADDTHYRDLFDPKQKGLRR